VLIAAFACGLLVFVGGSGSQPERSAIVFERGGDLYAVSIDGSRLVRLTRTRMREQDPAVSPDGRRIAFSRGARGISTMNVDGSNVTIWTRGYDAGPAWAPDGRTIYFARHITRFGAACGSIFAVSTTRRGARRVTNPRGSHQDPTVSPDGRRIALTDWNACEGGTASPRLTVVDIYGRRTGDLKRLRNNGYYPNPEHSSPAWSPDGTRLAFLKNSDLTIAYRDGSGERRVARGSGGLIYVAPAWSPDGRWIAFSTSRSSRRRLLVVRADGTGLRRVAQASSGDYVLGGWLRALPG
jgi:TolB protein